MVVDCPSKSVETRVTALAALVQDEFDENDDEVGLEGLEE